MPRLLARALPLAFALLAGAAHAAVVDPKVERSGPDQVTVSWSAPASVDVYLADRPGAGIEGARLVSGDDRRGRAVLPAPSGGRVYVLLKDNRDGVVTPVAERLLPLEQGSNFRDLGGYPAAGGKHVRWGVLYRSGATAMLTPADQARIGALGLKQLVDLRSSEERSVAPTRIQSVPYAAVGYSMMSIAGDAASLSGDERIHAVYRNFPTLLAPQLRIVFDALVAGEGPIAYNCSAGQDRTGFTTALVLTALGVPREVIFADYHLSTPSRSPRFEMPPLDAAQAANPALAVFAQMQKDPVAHPLFDSQQRPLLQFALDEIDARYGSVEAYLDKVLGVDAADIAKMRATYLR